MSAEAYEELGRKLRESYPTGAQAWENIKLWLEGTVPLVPDTALREFLDLDHTPLDLIHEAFWRSLPFGTGGVRGPVGFGPNRINPTVVALTIQAHCDFLTEMFADDRGEGLEKAVVIANDIREYHDVSETLKFLSQNPYDASTGLPGLKVTSRHLAYLAAGVYAKNGFLVYILKPGDDEAFLTTPELSFLIRRLRAAGGINLSASHNPPDDNGVKVYDARGGQYLPPEDEDLTIRTRNIRQADHMPYQDAVAAGLVRDIPQEALDDYMALYMNRAERRRLGSENGTKVLFTPLGGCGERTVKVGLEKLGYAVRMPEREGPAGTGPDGTRGTFGSIPMRIANPEVPESTRQSKAAAEAAGATLVLASDPDADRLGVEVYHDGAWRHLTGNQMATILAYFLLLDEDGPRLSGAVYETAVSTLAVSEIAKRAGSAHIRNDLLVGFKYIGHEVSLYQAANPAATDDELLSFATEESHGFLDTPQIRDKDAMSGALYLAKLHERLTARNETLIDYLQRIYAELGEFGDVGRSLVMRGSRGFKAIQGVMEKLREARPGAVAGIPISAITDRRDTAQFGPSKSGTDWEARNLLSFWFADGRISFRPSGTEPKLKFYVQAKASAEHPAAQEYAEDVAAKVFQYLLGVIGEVYDKVSLDDAFVALPDVIALDTKVRLQDEVAPRLRELVSGDDFEAEFTARLFAELVGAYVPGESSWRATEPAFRAAARSWRSTESARVEDVFAYLWGART